MDIQIIFSDEPNITIYDYEIQYGPIESIIYNLNTMVQNSKYIDKQIVESSYKIMKRYIMAYCITIMFKGVTKHNGTIMINYTMVCIMYILFKHYTKYLALNNNVIKSNNVSILSMVFFQKTIRYIFINKTYYNIIQLCMIINNNVNTINL